MTVDELVLGVNIALGNKPADVCTNFDRNGDGRLTVDELVSAVRSAVGGTAG